MTPTMLTYGLRDSDSGNGPILVPVWGPGEMSFVVPSSHPVLFIRVPLSSLKVELAFFVANAWWKVEVPRNRNRGHAVMVVP